ncbi:MULTISPECIES: energy transducer TonB [Marinimicrobium]|uniref:Protein TonB n=1 Tax=Marinimicrobium koreense TaxID=306545 RepID=A0A3N1NQR3_9GAMM|nr:MULTISPECIES: energy transducer TonB [Marinimicrobium]MAN52534.1 energy transducer TonB [Marinimicrobium sp.]ROQ18545.1 protein TonB [Marinimicrobium koreense]
MRASHVYAPPMALVTTFGLLLLMYSLINTDFELPVVTDPPKIEPVVMAKPEPIETIIEAPTRPEPPALAPEPIAEPVVETQVTSVTEVSVALPSLSRTEALTVSTGGDLMAIVKVAPQYPRLAATRGIEGFVTVEYTVTATGRTADVVIVEAVTTEGQTTSVFDRAAIAAAEQFKYQPRVQDGVAVDVHGVRNRFVFELD